MSPWESVDLGDGKSSRLVQSWARLTLVTDVSTASTAVIFSVEKEEQLTYFTVPLIRLWRWPSKSQSPTVFLKIELTWTIYHHHLHTCNIYILQAYKCLFPSAFALGHMQFKKWRNARGKWSFITCGSP